MQRPERRRAGNQQAPACLERNRSREESELIEKEIYNIWAESLFVGPN